MNQHSFQKAYYDSFCDVGGQVWVFPKGGGLPFRKPTTWCTAETNFQSAALEKAQADVIESPGIKALRNLSAGKQSDSEFDATLQWIALHLIRGQKMRDVVAKSGDDYEQRFPKEFESELLYLKTRYSTAYTYTCGGAGFFVTSDNPIVEVGNPPERLLLFALSPQKFVRLSSEPGELTIEGTGFEDFANAMTCSTASKYIYSHRKDVDTDKYRRIAQKHAMLPQLETEEIVLRDFSGKIASQFPQK